MTINQNHPRTELIGAKQLSHTRKLLTTKEISSLTGFSASFYEKGRVYGYGPKFLRIRGKVLYHLDALNEWLSEHECKPKGGNNV